MRQGGIEMIAPKHAQLAAIKDAINTFIDRCNDITFHRKTYGNPMKGRAQALVKMDAAILDAILFDWVTEGNPTLEGSYMVVIERLDGKRFMCDMYYSVGGGRWEDGDYVLDPVEKVVAYSPLPSSKALGGK